MTDLQAWGRAVLDAERRGMSTRQACEWATDTTARTRAMPSAQMVNAGATAEVRAHASAARVQGQLRAAEVQRARKRWTDAEAAGRMAALRLRHAREHAAGLAWAAEYGYLF